MTDETQAHAHPGEEAAWEPDPRRWRILGVSLVIGFMSLLDVTIVNVAIPSIRAGLDTTAANVQWIVSGYALAFGLTLVTGGRLGDAHGRRLLMVVGLTGFTLASAAVGLAANVELVILARLVQGASAGLLTPQNSGLIQDLFRGPERGRAFGLFGLTVSLSSGLGPLIGGAIIGLLGEENGWRYLFLVNVPIGLVAMVAIWRLVPSRPAVDGHGAGGRDLDLVGAALLGLGVLAVLYPLVSVEGGSRLALLLLPLAPVLLVGFTRWEARVGRRGRTPLLDVTLLRQVPGYASGIAVGSLYFTGFTGIFLVLSVFLQEQLDYSPLAAGAMTVPFALGAALTAQWAGRLVSRIGRRITVISLVVMMTGVALLALLVPLAAPGPVWWVIVPTLLIAGLGGGGVISPNFTLSLDQVPPRMGGAAGAALQTGQRIGSAVGAALLMTAYQATLVRVDDPARALQAALVTALVVITSALTLAVRDLRLTTRN